MKILKPQTYSFLSQPIELGGKQWLSVAVMLYFDLTAPDSLQNEQDLWQEVPPLLGEIPLIDQGWPKPRAEFLVVGACCAPGKTQIQGGRVSVSVGSATKELAVFGDRHWQKSGFGLKSISYPVPFNEMPITWERAFGGLGFEFNPAGRGAVELTDKEGKPFLPLPNIEDPANLLVSPSARPAPCGFGIVPAHYPQRSKLSGTYDARWKRERWPSFPDDLHPDFFLAASTRQQMPGYFSGSETIEIRNMHHEMLLITSRLPKERVRLFFLKRPGSERQTYLRQDLLGGEFFEAKLNPETLWLFPSILRGVLLYRTLVPCRDDEYSDLAWAHIAGEDPESVPLSLEHYRDYVLEKADFGQSVVAEAMQKIQRELGKGAIAVRNLPKKFKADKAALEGNAPQVQTTFQDMQSAFTKGLQGQREMANEIEAGMRTLHEQFGHRAAIDFGMLERARASITEFEEGLAVVAEKNVEVEKKKDDMLSRAGAKLKAEFTAAQLKEKVVDPDHLDKPVLVSPFHDRWFPFVVRCRMMLGADIPVHKQLSKLGIEHDVVSRNWLGWLDSAVEFAADGFLKEPLMLPPGLVIPRFRGARLTGLLIRPEPLTVASLAVIIPDSDETPIFLEAAAEGGPLVIMQDELAAFLIEGEAGDFAAVTVLPDPEIALPESAEKMLKEGAPLVVMLPESSGTKGLEPWEKAFPGILCVFLHDSLDLFEAKGKGVDLREEILKHLPLDLVKKHRMIIPEIAGENVAGTSVEEAMGEDAMKAAIEKGFIEVKAAAEAKMAPMMKMAAEKIAYARAEAAKYGKTIPDPPPPKDIAGIDFAAMLANSADKLDAERVKLLKTGMLSPEKAEQMRDAAIKVREEGPAMQKRMVQLSTMEPPEELKAEFAKHGIDVADLKAVTPEDLQQRLDAGRSFRMTSFRKLDLSGIDFSGRDLSMASFDSCIMTGCLFEGAKMEGTMISKCDLGGADLSGALLERTMFSDCKLHGMRCVDTRVYMASFSKCDLAGADFTGSTLKLITVQKGSCKNVVFERSRIELASISETEFTGARMAEAFFSKVIMRKCRLDGLTFPRIETNALLLHECTGEKVRFEHSKLFKLRIVEKSSMPGLVIANSQVGQGYFRNAELKGASFSGCSFKGSIFDGCDLTNADFSRALLYGCKFPKSDLEGANLSKSNLFMGSLQKARMVSADLTGANLYGVDFRKCVMGGTKMGGANLKQSLIDGREKELKDGGYIL